MVGEIQMPPLILNNIGISQNMVGPQLKVRNSKPCCKCYSENSECTNCQCTRGARKCTSCRPLLFGKCATHKHSSQSSQNSSQTQSISTHNSASFLPKSHDHVENHEKKFSSLADEKMTQAFGVPLLNTEGKWKNDQWEQIWKRVVALRGKLYSLPGGAVGRKFVSCFSAEIIALGKGQATSEISICFPPLILQRDENITKMADIRRLISRRLQLWNEGKYNELISEAEICNKKLPNSQIKMTDDKALSIFTRLFLSGKIREAVRFIIER